MPLTDTKYNTGPLTTAHSRKVRAPVTTPRILIVEDEPGVRTLLFDVLSKRYLCDCAEDAPQALKLAMHMTYDVVLCDIMLPGTSGKEVLKHFHERGLPAAVIMITGATDPRLAVDALRFGAFDYLLKPFSLDELEACVDRGVQFKRLQEESRVYQRRLESLLIERTSQLQETNDRLETALLEQAMSYRSALGVLTAALEARGIEDEGHTERVTAFALRLGKALDLSPEELKSLESGALLHDVGMISIPETILRRPGGLAAGEWELLKRHTEYGAVLVRRIGYLADAAPIVEQHHERWDGKGYPNGLRGAEINRLARIFAVADCIDAMTSSRPHSGPRSMWDVAEELQLCAGSHFDPEVVEAFLSIPYEEWESIRQEKAVTVPVCRVTGPLTPVLHS